MPLSLSSDFFIYSFLAQKIFAFGDHQTQKKFILLYPHQGWQVLPWHITLP